MNTADFDYWAYCAGLEPVYVETEHTSTYDTGSIR